MSSFRIIFFGTPEFAKEHLIALIKDEHFEIAGVVTQPDRPSGRKMILQPCAVKKLALENGIPVISPENVNSLESLETIKNWKAEAVIVVAFGQILSQKLLDLFPQKIVNIHGSLLPKWRGAAPIQRAIIAGDTETGVALQVMVKKLDAGDILGLRKVKLDDSVSALTLHDILANLGGELLHVELMDYLRGNLVPVPQNENEVTYAVKIDKKEALIDFNESANEIHRKVLGLSLGPGTHTFVNGKIFKIHKTQVVSSKSNLIPSKPGDLLVKDNQAWVQCGQNLLELLEVQPESKPKMSIKDFLKGNKLPQHVG